MIPRVFDKSATSFGSLGLGGVTDAIECIVREERNKSFTLTLTAPANSARRHDLSVGNIIVADASPGQKAEPFDIVSVSRDLDRITVEAEHVSYRLMYALLKPYSISGISNMLTLMNTASSWVGNTQPGFTFSSSGITSSSTCAQTDYQRGRDIMAGIRGSMLDVFGGTWKFTGFGAKLMSTRGSDKGARIIYGANLQEMSAEADLTDTVTGVFGVWKEDEVTKVTTSQIWQTSNASNYAFSRVVIHDFSSDYNTQPTQATLDTAAQAWLSGKGNPTVNLDVSFVPLNQTLEYKDIPVADIEIDDTVHIYVPSLGLTTDAKCIATEYNALLDRYETVEIGNYRTTLADAIRRLV